MKRQLSIMVTAIVIAAGAMVALPSVSAAPAPPMGGGYTNYMAIPVDDADTSALAGALFKPAGAGPFPTVIYLGLCASFDDEGERAVQKTLVEHLPAKGFATLVLDQYAPRHQDKGVCEELDAKGSWYATRGAEDAYAALNALAKLPEIDAKRVFLLGYGIGATAALYATDSHVAANHPLTFAGTVTYSPYCGLGTDFPVPTLVLIGEQENDGYTASSCQAIEGKPNLDVVVYPGATNPFAVPGRSDFMSHPVAYDEKATKDAQARTDAFLAAHMK